MTVYTVYFRGVGLLDMDQGVVREVLFPNAEPRSDAGDEWGVPGGGCVHPDGTKATTHYARAVSVSGAPLPIDSIVKNCWIRGGAGTNGSRLDSIDQKQFASVAPLMKDATYGIALMSRAARELEGRIATRFSLNGGRFRCTKLAETQWSLTDRDSINSAPTNLALWTEWSIELAGDLVLEVMRLDGTPLRRLVLTSTNPKICFANFEDHAPTWARLSQPTWPYDAGLVDHDFKWLYRMFDIVYPARKTWKDVLGTDMMIAPIARQGYRPMAAIDALMAPTVSTCFPAIWTGDTVAP